MNKLVIRPAAESDAPVIAAIYNPYIKGTTITFEEETVSAEEIQRRMGNVRAMGLPWLSADVDGHLAGYAYATRWRERSAYRYTAESIIYFDQEHAGQGYGKQLYSALKTIGIHAVIGVIALPNPASVALHENLGFKKVAHFSEVGCKFGRWLDVGYWQRNL